MKPVVLRGGVKQPARRPAGGVRWRIDAPPARRLRLRVTLDHTSQQAPNGPDARDWKPISRTRPSSAFLATAQVARPQPQPFSCVCCSLCLAEARFVPHHLARAERGGTEL